ncbi:electron transfer flavoprotein subunit alpha [Paraoerskovia sediminicola]|uniref:Electron transfer flavoprotein subunit alpha n=1 Tax=Paraoerskovia sediminicola TaxID=1138587 RepID=A0ABM8G4N3_9CELL|nr:electron transfer flavoprotein subunit alpha/FixB family protein [Paraoerskovia sediminicola]BDZ43001.1 electron transfer flavoprotein subunit alpha [Paraoerskovia sediminicola]
MTDRTVLVLIDHAATALRSPALELLTVARTLGEVEAVTLEPASDTTLGQLGAHGVGTLRQVELDGIDADQQFLTPVVAEALGAAVDASGASVVLLTSSFAAKESAARLAFARGAGLVTDATAVTVSDAGRVVASKRPFAGTWDTACEITTDLAVLTVPANSAVAAEAAQPVATAVEAVAVTPTASATRARLVSRTVHPAGDRPDLAEAAVVVTGGRGTDGDFGPVLDLADALGAAVGASRDAVYEGWFDEFVGQTGVTVSPRLYVGAGISGAPHHRGGMQSSQVIVAVNNDPECPLFEISDFAVVGDLAEVLPQAAAAIRAHRGA